MADRYWVQQNASDDWKATSPTNWGSASGVADNASVPTLSDDVFFDNASGTGTVSSAGPTVTCRSFNLNGWRGSIAITGYIEIYGDVDLTSDGGSITTSSYLKFSKNGSQTLISAGKTINGIYVSTSSTTLNLGDNLNSSNYIIISGTFNSNNYTISAGNQIGSYKSSGIFNFGSSTVTCTYLQAQNITGGTFNLDSSTINITSTNPFSAYFGQQTVNQGTSTINITNAGTVTANLYGKTFYNLNFNQNGTKNITGGGATVENCLFGGSSGTVNILDANDLKHITINGGKTIKFKEGITHSIHEIIADGSSSAITIGSITAGTQFKIYRYFGWDKATLKNCMISDCSFEQPNTILDATYETNEDMGNNSGIAFKPPCGFF
jgi:hypothetical protein